MTSISRPSNNAQGEPRRSRRLRPRALPGFQEVPAQRGHLYYLADPAAEPPTQTGVFRPRIARPSSLCVSSVPADFPSTRNRSSRESKRRSFAVPKLTWSKANAKRFLRLVAAPSILSSATATKHDEPNPATQHAADIQLPALAEEEEMVLSERPISILGGGPMHRPTLQETLRSDSGISAGSDTSLNVISGIGDEKPVATGNGVSVYLSLTEPVLFLQGFDNNDFSTSKTSMLRGSLHLKVAKTAKIKKITLKFSGRAETEWPEGIPPRRQEYKDSETFNQHYWPFFNAQFDRAENSYMTDHVQLAKNPSVSTKELGITGINALSYEAFQLKGDTTPSSRDSRRLSLPLVPLGQSRSFGKSDSASGGSTVAQKGFKVFYPGEYIYNFELPVDSKIAETISVDLGSVKYELEAVVERAGAFRANLLGSKEVTFIRAPAEGSLEQVEPIAISRNWEDQLHYDIVISGKSFPLGSQIPIAFKLTPLAKVQCHRIKVFVTEMVQYYTKDRRVHRMEPNKKILLFEKRADSQSQSTYEGSSMRVLAGGGIPYDRREAAAMGDETGERDRTNLLGDLSQDWRVGPTEMEFNVQLPSCHQMREKTRDQRLHPDTTYTNIVVNHWIKIVMRLSKPDEKDSTKRRHFEISIDSPFHILSCRATQANTSLPAYKPPGRDGTSSLADEYECGCPGAAVRRRNSPHALHPILGSLQPSTSEINLDQPPSGPNRSLTNDTGGLARPQAAHLHGPNVARPMHLLRAPSFNPPAFEDDLPPPPLITPPPDYGDVVSGDPTSVLADYFSRLADDIGDDSDSDRGSVRRDRVDVPLTPGARVNRSMDARRDWLPLGTDINPRMPR